MWLRHFLWRRRQKKFKAFRDRYYKFDTRDCVDICAYHHEEIHVAYKRIIDKHIRRKDFKPCRRWTWEEAESLMKELRRHCSRWLKKETPGLPLSKYRNGYEGVSQ